MSLQPYKATALPALLDLDQGHVCHLLGPGQLSTFPLSVSRSVSMPNTPRMWRLTNLQADLPILPGRLRWEGITAAGQKAHTLAPEVVKSSRPYPKVSFAAFVGLRLLAYSHRMWRVRFSYGAAGWGSSGVRNWGFVTPGLWTPDRHSCLQGGQRIFGCTEAVQHQAQNRVRNLISAAHFPFWLTTTALQQEEDVLPAA